MNSDCNEMNGNQAENLSTAKLDLPEGVPPLNTFYLYITNGCNLACRHCWITPSFVNGKPSPGDCLDFDLLKLAVREGKTLGLANAKLTGGEPMLHPHFIEIVDYLSAESIKLSMETNGTLIEPDVARYMKQNSAIGHISVSLDSAQAETHDQFRGIDGAFAATTNGIRHLVNAGFRPQVIMSTHRGNVHEVADLIALAVDLGAGSVKFNPVTPTGRGEAMTAKGETLAYDEIMGLVRFIRGELQRGFSIPLILSTPPALTTIGEILRNGKAGVECRVMNILGILGNGEMALCGIGRNVPALCFGKLGRDDLRGVWTAHPTLIKLRLDLAGDYPGVCRDCIHNRRCLTQCVAMNYVRTGELIHPDFLCQEAERQNQFPATRRRSYTCSPVPHAV